VTPFSERSLEDVEEKNRGNPILVCRSDVDDLEDSQRCGVQQEDAIFADGAYPQGDYPSEDLEPSVEAKVEAHGGGPN
jgi:hypothetical protein